MKSGIPESGQKTENSGLPFFSCQNSERITGSLAGTQTPEKSNIITFFFFSD